MVVTECSRIPVGTKDVRINFTVRECGTSGLELVDLTNAANFRVCLLSPSGVIKPRVGSLTGVGTEGRFGYTLQAADIDEAGDWQAQGFFELPSGTGPFPTSVEEFQAFLGVHGLTIASPGLTEIDVFVPRVTGVLS